MLDKKNQKEFFEIQRIYIKDISFEAPHTPNIFHDQWEPSINLNVNNKIQEIEKNIFEIVLKIKVIVKIKDKLTFLCDLDQAGIFLIMNINGEKLKHCLHSYCPNILFPYARACIANLISYGSFPPINLAPINFDALYDNYIKSKK
ncbi:protein-export chaperone SecB [Buchnera aphidicola]|uniref:Protein-export protein SecB n=1 Tax=Buchnera aphidicola subsp. Uroleucon sonchi TaxID=118118 RepID=A0A6C1F5R4_BUCUN|nr:protein-export chaperone SecB [Buchnera aphidicola]QIE01813.1 protein-export chaperone SecB [Buchnera aphidicola (Uroleucon sonchi)]